MKAQGDPGEDEMIARCKSMKQRLKELQRLRITSVLTDIEDIKQKIAEHQKVHEESVVHLKHENAKLVRLLREREAFEDEIVRIKESNQQLRGYLAKREPALEAFIRPGSGFTVHIIQRREFEISFGDDFRAKIIRKHDDVICQFLSVPDAMSRRKETEFAQPGKSITFQIAEIPQFCARIRKSR